jgi:hypothetical protein
MRMVQEVDTVRDFHLLVLVLHPIILLLVLMVVLPCSVVCVVVVLVQVEMVDKEVRAVRAVQESHLPSQEHQWHTALVAQVKQEHLRLLLVQPILELVAVQDLQVARVFAQ